MASRVGGNGDGAREEGDRVRLGIFELRDGRKVAFNLGGGGWAKEP